MRDMKYLYAYKHKQTGNVILTRSVITSKDWEMIEDHTKPADSDPEEKKQDASDSVSAASLDPAAVTDSDPEEKPASTATAAKKKAPNAAKKSTGKKV